MPSCRKKLNYAFDKYSQAYGEIVSCFRHLARDRTLQLHITQKILKTSNNYPDSDPSHNFYVFGIRHIQHFISAQANEVSSDFRPSVPPATNLVGYALLLTNK